jgi:hypothetical protein
MCKYLGCAEFIAYASTIQTRRGRPTRQVDGRRGPGRARIGGLAGAAAVTRDADAPAREGSLKETGLALADSDVQAQVALAGGELRMTELADRALISRSGMTRRVARLVDVGLVHRANARLDDQELAVLESALEKVTLDCTFG